MKLFDFFFPKPAPPQEPWLPRVLPGRRRSRDNIKEYLRKMHLASTYWKRHDRNSYEAVLSRAEARLAHMVFQAFQAGESEHLLTARIASVKSGWPFFPLQLWQTGARYLLRSFNA
jgi:hypothetical protein